MRRLLLLGALLMLSNPLLAGTSERLREASFSSGFALNQETLERKNQSVLTYLWVDVYAAAFYAPRQANPRAAFETPLSHRLELYYFRDIDREDVIEAAWTTLSRQHDARTLEPLRDALDGLHESFRDIRPGDRYALNFSPDGGLTLERNGKIAFTSQNPQLAKVYLGIWLAPKGLSDELRNRLLAP
jgi:hypothetical protein